MIAKLGLHNRQRSGLVSVYGLTNYGVTRVSGVDNGGTMPDGYS